MAIQDANEKARESAKRAKQMPEAVQYAIVQVLPNILNGAFWGFTDLKDIQSHLDVIKNNPDKLVARKLGNACLIEVNHDFMLSAVNAIDPNAIKSSDLVAIKERMADAVIEMEKFLISRGKKQPASFILGIYSTNKVTTIAYKGVNYPAFRLPMSKTLELLHNYGYSIKVNGTWMSAQNAMGSGQALWDSTRLSPTNTGIFIEVCPTLQKEQMLQLENKFKQRNSLK